MKTEEKATLESVPALATFWKCQVKKIHEVETAFTRKQFGQLKNLRDKLGNLTFDTVDRTLKNWDAFCHYTKQHHAVSCTPPAPNVGFLLVHAAAAVNAMHSFAKQKTAKSGADLDFIAKVDQAIADQKKEFQNDVMDSPSEVHLAEPTLEQAPQPIKQDPIKLKFTPGQRALLIEGPGTEQYEKFMAAISEKYGEDCIICGGDPEASVLCEIAV